MEVLRAHAGEQPARRAFTFLDQGEEESGHLTYGELDRQARTIAARLQEEGAGAGPALLLYPPGLEFIAGFFGCLYAGVVGVPVYPPGSPRGLPLLRSVAADCRPELILTTAARRARFAALTAELPALAGARWIASDAPAGDPNAWRPPDLAADRLAFLQYTSGSTAAPRGVMVTHGNLLHNQEAIRHTFGQSSASVIVGWLPLYHDMGLIGNVLQTVYVGASAVLMPPAAFLQRPARWLQAISRYRGTASGGPNFAFDLCVRRIDGADREQLDLGSWEVAYNGAETVRRETLESFAAAFAPCGFRPASLFPCYGLAEATLLVSGGAWQPSSGAVEPAGPAAERRPGCGRPAPGIEVAIADPVGGERRGPGEVGEIWVSGLGVARGYWRRPEESESTFQARLAGAPESAGAFLRTGDLGFLRGGELVVTGRLKELLVVRGRNHYPQDLELTAERAHPALRPGCGAAFAVEATAADGERLVLAYELARGSAAAAPYEVAAAVARALAAEHELRLHELVLLRPGSLPKTSSGKIRRRACRDGYLEGSLEVVARGGPTGAPDACSAEESAADGLPPEGSPVLLRELAAAAGVASDRFDPALPLTAYGLDSLAAALLQHRLETRLGIAVSVADLLAAESASALVETLLARSAEEESSAARPSPAEPDVASDLVLSPGQEWFWFLDRLLPGNPASTLIAVARVLSPLDVAALRQACTDLVARHGALRTTFHASAAGTPLRRVGRHPELYFQLLTSAAAGDATPEERLLAELHRPFDLETGPLLRIVVLAEDGETPRLGLAIHHLAADFWSLTVLAGELGIFYDRTCGEAAPLPAPLASGYDEHVLSLRRWLAGPRAEREWAYWSVRLAGAPFTLDLPTDHPRPPLPSFRGAAVRLRLGPAAEVAELASAHRTTPFAVLLASYLALLGRVTDQDDLLVGTPAAGRGAAGEAGVVGYFVNPLVLRAGLAGDLEFSTLLARTRAEVLAALAHQDLPFPLLAERLQPDRDPSRQPLFQAMFVLYRAPLEGLAACAIGEPGAAFGLGGLRLETLAGEERGAPSELTLRLAQVGGELVASLQYSTDLFEAVTARRLLRQFATLLGAALAAPGSRLDGLPLLAEAERQQLLGEWSEAAPPPAGEGWLHQLVLAQAARTPEAPALEGSGRRWTYRELADRVASLARQLAGAGVGPEVRVGLCADPSPLRVAAVLGVLAAGGAYVPLEPEYPEERLALLMADAGIRLVLAEPAFLPRLEPLASRMGMPLLPLSPPAGVPLAAAATWPAAALASPDQLAYVLYTSGSTGRPKGVPISHRSLLPLLADLQRRLLLGPGQTTLAITSLSFDISVVELFLPLAAGARVVVASREETLDSALLGQLLARTGATFLQATPSTWRLLLAAGWEGQAGLEILCGGEALPRDLADALRARGARLWNLYGPTETAIYAAGGEVTAEPLPVAAGRPLGSARLYVLDAAFEAVAAGAVGELYVGGDGLSRGYLAAPGLTAERFLPDRFAAVPERAGGRLYRTGDRARWRRDGSLEILGRADAQVKVRGVRIEPGEIEAALARHPAVQEAAVGMREELPGGRGLVAYVVPRQAGALTPALLRDHLRRSLPEALVPAHFELRAGALPRMASGKIDRRGLGSAPLATLESWSEDAGGTHREPRTPLEELLAGIFAEVLGRARVGADERFFDLGGHSLLATQVISRVREVCGVELPLRQLFEAPTAAGLAAAVVVAQTAGKAAPPPILRLPRGGELPASFAQARLWFLEQLGIGGAAYNLPAGLRLTGSLDPAALAAALAAIVRRHECLRTTFAAVEGRVIQVVAPPSALPLPIVDLSGLPGLEGEASKIAGEAAKVPFDLTRGPLLRTALLALGDGEHVLLLTMHHIVSDGWSMGVFLRELAAFYEGFAENRPPTILELPLQYADFARWQREWLRGDVLAAQLGYWRERLAGAPALLELPADRPRPAVASSRGARAILQVSAERTAALRDLGRQQGATLFMELLAAFQALLARTSGQDDVLVGTPIANRTRAETEGLIGFFVNTLVLRADLSGGPGFGDLLQQVRETTLGAYAHQDLPFEKLVEELRPERALSHSPLFQAMLTLQNAPLPAPRVAGLAMIPFEVAGDGAKFDLTLRFVEAEGGGLTGQLEYARDLFDAPTMARFLGRLEALLAAAVADPRRPLAEIVLLGAGERHQVVHEWNDTAAAFPRDLCLHQLFAAQAARTPASVAVVGAAERLTYGELEARANRLARCLRGLGVGPETRVGIALSRTPDLLVGLLGILKAGGAYVPLDPSYPRERLELILADAQQGTAAPVLVTEQGLLGRLPAFGGRTLCLDRDRAEIAGESASPLAAAEIGVEPSNLAYVIYTSGSTGRPKGVAIAHASAVALIGWASGVYGDAELAGVLASTSITFDLSVFELFLPLARGGKVILAENALALPELAAAAEVTLVNTVPSALAELLRVNGMPASVAVVNLAGEPLRSSLASRLHGLGTVRGMWNLYGPTEDTTYSTCARVAADEGREPTIGRPIAGSRAYVLDREQRPQPVGVPGELCLGGRGLARGYLDRPDLTARSFLPDPCSQTAGERLYRTGDLARFLPDGRLEFVGRLDHQVKLRGFRIELGEIEARLLAHPAVRESVVLAREDAPGEKRLVAYVVARSGDLATTASNLHAHLREALPDYMLPAAFVALDALPRTPNGKVDRKALPPPERERDETGYVAPRGPVEELLAGIWSEVLRAERIGARDSFFDLGGHSLLALQVVSRLRERCGLEVPVRALFEAPTLAGLARWIAAAEVGVRRELPPIARVPRADLLPLSFAQERMWFLHQLDPGSPLFNIAGGVRVQGCLRPPALTAALASLVRRHEALRTVFVAAGGQPRQRIAAAAPEPPLHELDLRGLPAERRDAELELIGEELSRQPFDLAAGPLLRAAIVRVAGPEDAAGAVDALLLSLHHLIADGWSLTVLVRELAAVYEARLRGQTVAFEELSVQPVDHAVWQRRWLRGEVLERELSYWRGELAGEPPGLALQADRPRGAAPGTRAGGRPLDLPPALAASLADLGRREGVTLFMTALAGFAAVLGRQSGLEELWVGSPVAGRGRSEIEGLIGLFANTLVLRVDLADDPPVSRLLARIRASALAAYMHQDLPFDKLVAELRPSRGGGSPLFQAFLAVDPAAVLPVRLAGAPLLPWTPDRGATPFDLSFLLVARGGGLQGTLEYRRELFDAATIDRLAGHLAALLGGAAAGPDRRLSELPWLAPPERHQLLHEWSGATAFFAEGKLLHELFEEQAARRPWAVAVTDGGEALTYGELDARADRLARRLQGLGVAPEVRVGLCLERSPALIVGLLAILKAGGAYVPLDPAYPRERLSFLLADSGAGIVLTEETLLPALPEAAGKRPLRRIAIDTPPAEETVPAAPRRAASSPETLAYVIYTSGSTGHPKGSLISHRNVTRLLAAATPLFGLGAGDVWTLFHSFAFDFSVWEIWGALAAGGRLAIVPHWMSRSPADFAAFLAQERVTVLNQTPAAFRQLAQVVTGGPSGERPELPDLRLVILGGEALEVASLAPWLARFGDERPRLVNMYGITETTVHVTARRLEARDLRQPGRSPIGAPLADLRIYLLDRWGGLAPTGAAGEVHVGGPGLARGYLGRPELTALRFVPDPFAAEPGERLYRTGDLARYRAAGDLEYLGRADDQVKVRGFRIEPGEVEAALASHPAVAEAAVVARRGAAGEPSLVAYVALRRGVTEGTAALRRHLKERLPEPLLPAAYVVLPALPLTAHGKVDRRALPEPAADRPDLGHVALPPRTAPEAELAATWCALLGLSEVGVEDSFFDLGGHSLLFTRLASRLRAQFGVEVPLRVLFDAPTIVQMTVAIAALLLAELDGGEAADLLREVAALSPAAAVSELAAEAAFAGREALLEAAAR